MTIPGDSGGSGGTGSRGRAPAACPACGREGTPGPGPGDLVVCLACRAPFWAVEGEARGQPVRPPEREPLSTVGVAAFHAGVLAAEAVLAAAVVGILAGLPVLAAGRLARLW